MDAIEVHMAMETEGTLITGMIIKIKEPAAVNYKGTFSITEVEVKIIRFEGNEDSGMETTPITMTEITGIEIPKVKVILIGAGDGIIVEVKGIVIGEEGEDGILISNTMTQGTNNRPSLQTRIIITHQFANPNHYRPPPMGHQYRYPIPHEQYSYPQQQQYQSQMLPAPSWQAKKYLSIVSKSRPL